MDVRLLLTLLALCLTCTGSNITFPSSLSSVKAEGKDKDIKDKDNSLSPSATSITTKASSNAPPTKYTRCPCGTTPPHTLSPPAAAPALAILQVTWLRPCEGRVDLSVLQADSLPLCQSSQDLVLQNWTGVCQRPGCLGDPDFFTQDFSPGRKVLENGTLVTTICQTLMVRCKAAPPPPVGPDLRGQLVAYKVLSALLCVVFLLLLVARFGQPSLRVLQKRLSDRRQSRWIGPTQSQSVSYHRGKSAVQDTDESKRSSFPALERLTVNYSSREPSSNRNSDYDSYN